MGARGQKLISPIEGEENATLEINGFAYKNKETSSFVFKVELDGNFNLKGINYTIKYLGTISKPLNNKLYRSENIIIAEEKKIVDKKERYLNQYNEAELNWVKSGVLRFYHKSKPPVNSATSLVIDK